MLPLSGCGRAQPAPYSIENGLYLQSFPARPLSGVFSTFQTGAAYSDALRLNSDSVMVYIVNMAQLESRFSGWKQQSDSYRIDMMIAVNRDNAEWIPRDPEKHSASIQKRKDGSLWSHPGGVNCYYMVPTKEWTEYVLELVTAAVRGYSPGTIVLEEPEMWHDSGYSDGFKAEWKDYYGTDWVDPASSPEAGYMSMRLKTYLFERIITAVAARVKELSPDTKVYIATHSTVNYNAWGITAGLNSYLALGVLDGVIGQTWSDTAYSAVPYRGKSLRDAFLSGYIEYASYMDSVGDTDFFALSDPLADNAKFTESLCRVLYRQTLTASLMQPGIARFQLFPWPERSFLGVSGEYKTVQCSVFSALDRVAGRECSISAGTPGIYVGLSDSLSWQQKGDKWSCDSNYSLYGMTLPLVARGIPVGMKSLEHISSPADLDGVKLLILSYDCLKPPSAEVNAAIADWVRAGGSLLYLGGHDAYESISGQWWSDAGTTPLEDLIARLGLDITVTAPTGLDCRLTDEKGAELENTFANDQLYGGFYAGFSGGTPLLYAGDEALAVEAGAGKGSVILCGLPSAYYAATSASSELFVALAKRAVASAGLQWIEAPLMTARRGEIVAAHALEEGCAVPGRYIDIFDPHLPIVSDPPVQKDDSVLLCDISGLADDRPRLAFTGGEIISLSEERDATVFSLRGPDDTLLSSRVTAPKGKYPRSVSASSGEVWCAWDNETFSLFVQSRHGAEVRIEWCGDFRESEPYPLLNELTVPTNSSGADAEYIASNTAFANSELRFCDGDGQLVYRFELTGKRNFTASFRICQNYILEYSADGVNFTVLADYSLINPEHLTTGGNDVTVTADPAALGVAGELWVRLRNTDTTKGWGGSIRSFTLRWGEQ